LEKRLLDNGYDNDRINADALSSAKVKDGALITKGGGRYQALVLPPLAGLDAATAETIAALAAQGLKVVFVDAAPTRDTGLAEAAAKDRRVVAAVAAARARGATLVSAADLPTMLRSSGVAPNLTFEGQGALFVERASGARRILFLHNTESQQHTVTFTAPGKGRAELWDAWTGARTTLASQESMAGSRLSVDLAAGGSALIVLDPSKPAAPVVAETKSPMVMDLPLDGWSLSAQGFGPKGAKVVWSTPETRLGDWSALEPLARFAGQATYATTLSLAAKPKGQLWLDLGQAHDMAKVSVNGVAFAPLIGPYRVNVSQALKAGENRVEITVLTTPNNAMVDPAAPAMKLVKAQPAGLIGPVRLLEQ
jgi:hypothetical protein